MEKKKRGQVNKVMFNPTPHQHTMPSCAKLVTKLLDKLGKEG